LIKIIKTPSSSCKSFHVATFKNHLGFSGVNRPDIAFRIGLIPCGPIRGIKNCCGASPLEVNIL
jgi:hypothetical protein